jgi:GT2 family glycosyltransferase
MERNVPDISVVTISYNSLDDTLRMIRSLKQVVRSVSLELIVVDNASCEDEAAAVAREFPDVVTIRSERNLGFSGGNNLGLAVAKGRYAMLLNNDTYIERDGFGKLVERMDADPKIGACSPKIRFAAPPHPIQFAGFTPLSGVTMRNSLVGYMEPDDGRWDTPREIPYAHGAAMMVSRAALDAAGPMPEEYFLYYEELDWSITIREHGFRIWYEPACTVFHRDGQAGKPITPQRSYFLTRNRMLLAWRKAGRARRLASVAYQLVVAVPKNALVALLGGRADVAAAMLSAGYGFLAMKKGGH